MNKEVIYLEPEDDITDILTKLQQAEQKLVALIPPKKATTLRSAVNMKLVARVAKECDKIAVIVTSDPAIVKMAIGARIPVAKSLNSRPVIPTKENLAKVEENIQVIDEATGAVTEEKRSDRDADAKPPVKSKTRPGKSDADIPTQTSDALELDDETLAHGSHKSDKHDQKNPAKAKSKSGTGNPFLDFMSTHRKWFAIGASALVVLIAVFVWAFVFAPAATVTVAVGSSSQNFSEDIRFTTEQASASPKDGILYALEQKLEQKYSAEFVATGEENHGDKAKGSVSLSLTFIPRDTADFEHEIAEGTIFTAAGDKNYRATSSASLKWAGDTSAVGCSSNTNMTCTISASVTAEAIEGGASYNLATGASWAAYQGLTVTNGAAFSGGTDDMVKVVSADDVQTAAEALLTKHDVDGKKMLLEDIGDKYIAIDASYKAEAGETTSSPAAGELVKDGSKPEVTVRVNFTIRAIEKSAVEEFVKAKLAIGDDQRLYGVKNAYIDRFSDLAEAARLKATVETGPVLSEDAIFEKISGRKTGEVSSLLKTMTGVRDIKVETSFFWVSSIPTDRSKVTIIINSEGGQNADSSSEN